MKKIGIVGGVGWRSTVDYYTQLCERSERRGLAMCLHGVPSLPPMCIESLDLALAIAYIGTDGNEDSWLRFDDYHRAALTRLAASGADFALLASNTPHERFDAIVRGVPIPVIDLFAVTARACARLDAPQVLILGTRFTMSSARLCNEFAKVGVAAQGPGDEMA